MATAQECNIQIMNLLKDYIIELVNELDTNTDKLKPIINKFENNKKELCLESLLTTSTYIDVLNSKLIKDELTMEQFIEELVKVYNNLLE